MRTLLVSALLLLPAPAAMAAGCAQDHAIYAAASGGYELHFGTVGAEAAATTHLFTLVRPAGSLTLDGVVLETDAPVRSNAIVMKDCPEGDVTGADLRACTGFDGYAYGLTGAGGAENLPSASAPAAPAILLAGLGPALSASPLAERLKLDALPGDVFLFRECRP